MRKQFTSTDRSSFAQSSPPLSFSYSPPLVGRTKSPEDLPRLKEKSKAQIGSFEKDKESANSNVQNGLSSLSALQKALEDTKNEDKEFAKVYGDWEKLDKKVTNLNKESDDLKSHASNLFAAMQDQTNSLNDAQNKKDLSAAIEKARGKYNVTLDNTAKAIDKLKLLHADAVMWSKRSKSTWRSIPSMTSTLR